MTIDLVMKRGVGCRGRACLRIANTVGIPGDFQLTLDRARS